MALSGAEQTAVDEDILSGHVARITRQQEGHHARAVVFRVADAMHRDERLPGCRPLRIGINWRSHPCAEQAWRNGVDAHAVCRPFQSKDTHQHDQRGFAGAVGPRARVWLDAGHGSDRHKCSPACLEVGVCGARKQPRATYGETALARLTQ